MLRAEAKEPPNLNGHHRLAHWGCGTNCIEWAIIDLRDGVVWMAPRPLLSCAGGGATDDWFASRADSSLLYVHSCERDRGLVFDTRRVYRHVHGRLRLLRVDPLH